MTFPKFLVMMFVMLAVIFPITVTAQDFIFSEETLFAPVTIEVEPVYPEDLRTLRTMRQQTAQKAWNCFGELFGNRLNPDENEAQNIRGIDYRVEEFDRNGDEIVDIVFLYEMRSRKIFPSHYILLPYDHIGLAAEYIDLNGDGRCADIVPIEQLGFISNREIATHNSVRLF